MNQLHRRINRRLEFVDKIEWYHVMALFLLLGAVFCAYLYYTEGAGK